jgi:hypothetical protein
MNTRSCQERIFMSVVYSLYDALVSINVPDEKAKAVIDAMEREMMEKLATKSDLENVRLATKADLSGFRTEISGELKLLRQEMSAMGNSLSKDMQIQMAALQNGLTVRLGMMMAAMIAAATALVSAARYFS